MKIPPVVVTAVFAALMGLLPNLYALRFNAAWMVACVLACIGAAFCVAGVWEFKNAKTTVNPVNPETSTTLVIRGVYRWSRNPMYLGFTLVLLGLAIWLGKASALLLVPVYMAYLQHFQIRPEESALQQRFGASFERYCQQVRRWI
ncbi:MAG: methyltransferase family protein [Comamonas sp.]